MQDEIDRTAEAVTPVRGRPLGDQSLRSTHALQGCVERDAEAVADTVAYGAAKFACCRGDKGVERGECPLDLGDWRGFSQPGESPEIGQQNAGVRYDA